jgi:hypothetical protein
MHRQLVNAGVPDIVGWKNRTVPNAGGLSGGETGQHHRDREMKRILHRSFSLNSE